MERCASEAIGLANKAREMGHEAHVRIWTDAAAARGLALRSRSGAIKHMETKYFLLQQKEKNQELQDREDSWHSNPATWMTKHLDGSCLMMLCGFSNIKHIGGRPISAPKLTMDTDYISRASRAPAATTLVRQAAESESRCAIWSRTRDVDGYRADCWTAAGWITVVIMICCNLVGLELLWWKSGRVVETIDNGTKTLEDGRYAQDIPRRIMNTKYGKAAHCRNDCPFLFQSHVFQSLSWCSHCDPNHALEKRAWRRRVGL